MSLARDGLLRSLDRQRRLLEDSIVLTPVDSLPFALADRHHTAFLHGVYLTDKVRTREAMKDAVIQFAGREAAAKDLAAIHRLLADAFGGSEGSLRLLAGLHAHVATFMSIASIGQSVLLLSDEAGGHFSTQAILQRLGLRTIDLPVDYERLCIDRIATLELVERERPDIVFVDRSEGLRYEDFSFIGKLVGPVKVFDASQYVTQIITGRYETPLGWGFDLALFSLHKSFPGPQKAGIVSRENGDLWQRLLRGLSTLVSSSHAENSYLVGLSLLREEWLELYADRMLGIASALEVGLARRGVPIVDRRLQGRPDWPATHHLWIRSHSQDTAFEEYERLTEVNIQTNYRKLPYRLGYGLRLGTTFCSVAGLVEDDAEDLADMIACAISGEGDRADLRRRVRELAHDARPRAILPVTIDEPSLTGGRRDKNGLHPEDP